MTATPTASTVATAAGGGGGGGGGRASGRSLSMPLAAAFLVAEMSGSGVLALPKALANTAQNTTLSVQNTALSVQNTTLSVQNTTLSVQNTTLSVQNTTLSVQNTTLSVQNTTLSVQNTTLSVQNTTLSVQNTTLRVQNTTRSVQNTTLCVQNTTLRVQNTTLCVQNTTLSVQNTTLCVQITTLSVQNTALSVQNTTKCSEHHTKCSEHHTKSSEHHTKSSEHHNKCSEHHTMCSKHHTKSSEHHTMCSKHHTKSSEHHTKCSEHHTKCSEHHTKCSEHHDKATAGDPCSLVDEVVGVKSTAESSCPARWAGVPLMVVLCAAVGFAGTRLALCWVLLEEQWPEYRTPCRRPYPAIAYRALGKAGHYVSLVAQKVTLMGVSTVFLLLAAQLLTTLTADVFSLCAFTVILGCLLTPATWYGTPKDFWPASVAGVVVTVMLCVVVVVTVALEASSLPDPHHTSPSFSSFFVGFGTILFSFGGASTFPTIQNDMADRSQFAHSVVIAFVVLLALYLPVTGVGYALLGDDVSDNILLSVSGAAVTFTKLLILTHLLFAFVIIFNPVAQGLEEVLRVPHEFGWRRCVVRTGLVLLEVLAGLTVPDFRVILNLVGGSTITLMSFVLPPLCYLRLSAVKDDLGQPHRAVGVVESVVLWGVVSVGVVGGLVTTYTAGASIVTPGVLQRSCFL
ncbi:uncharacterized protein [Panulirus ornatus]|uniref:uncharacterized protein n=1 Tax=Panulirus ornatus TaxID=150431 RepID=UPI003A8721CE